MRGNDGRRLPGRPHPGSEVDEELAFHLEMMAAELRASGLSAKEARRQAKENFGDVETTRRYCRKQDRLRKRRRKMAEPLGFLRDELALATRTLVRRPRSVLAPLLILALAVGLNALVLSVVRGVLLAPLPFQEADRVAVVEEINDGGGLVRASYPVLDAWRHEARQVEALAAFVETRMPLNRSTGSIHAEGALVTQGFFGLLTDPFRSGRPFTPEEHEPGAPKVVAISEGLWERALGKDPQVLSRRVELGGETYQVVAVIRKERVFPDGAEIWLPVEPANPDLLEIAGAKIFTALARLRPGIDVADVGPELAEISARVPGGSTEASAVRLGDRLLGDVRTPLLLLQGAVLLVLLAAAANAGSLLLARGVQRRGEMALRASLGAGSGRVAAGLLLEGLILGSLAGLAGLALARLTLQPALTLVPVDLPRAAQIALSPGVVLLGMVLAAGTGMATALIPALTGSRTAPSETLRESNQGGGTPPWIRGTLEGFVVAQVALAVLLTAGAGLLIRSFISTIQEDPGFDPSGITLLDVSLPDLRYPDQESYLAFAQELLSRAETLPGAQAVALGRNLPISGSNMTSPLKVEGSPGMTSAVQVAMVTKGYFEVLGIPFIEGAGFGDADRPDGPPQLIVTPGVRTEAGLPVAMGDRAHSFFGAQDFRDVVGVVRPVRHRSLRAEPVPIVYEPFLQKGGAAGFTLLIRSDAPAGVVARSARELVRGLDSELAVDQVTTMDARISRSLAEPRFYTLVLSVFGTLAVFLALAGCQAGLAHRVAARRREIGVRVALGSPASSVRWMILRRGLLLTGAGTALGFLAAVPGTRLLESQLYGVTAGDPLTHGALLLFLLGAGAMASDVPARRAAALDPAEVLKEG
ncbi:MAG: ABC transporter permease [Longimicrobiales bacterium]